MDYKTVTKCRVCGSKKLTKYLDLGEVPLANNFESKKEYPIELLICGECYLSQLSVVVDPKILYANYPYHSSVSLTFKKHCRDMARKIKEILGTSSPLVCDIASNDGCLLEQFQEEGFYVVGVEPSENLVKECHAKGLTGVTQEFWDEEAAKHTPACDVITATNVLAHVDDVKTFVSLAKQKLRAYRQGIMVVEVPYAANLFNYVQFDTIYHEHLSYFLFKPLVALFESVGMPIFRVEKVPVHGGSLRIYASHYGRTVERSVGELLAEEGSEGFWEPFCYKEFTENIEFVREDLPFLLCELKREGKKVLGFGASAKGISLLNYCEVTNEEVPFIVDETFEKQGKNTPGSNIPIVSFEAFEIEKPDYILLLAWNFKEELIAKTKHFGAKYIIPIPTVEIL
jgi:hypothetical protein